jgi:hypothetical protein
MMICGGTDIDENYSRRALLLSKYHRFYEKPPMVVKRAFFPSVFNIYDSSVYVMGGQDGISDIATCERYSVSENTWRVIKPMHHPKNGASAVSFEKCIFVFGGHNDSLGALDTIEKYSVTGGKWFDVKIRLQIPIHDSLVWNLGGARVLIYGGTNSEGLTNDRYDIYDLTVECMNIIELSIPNGKYSLPGVYEPAELWALPYV